MDPPPTPSPTPPCPGFAQFIYFAYGVQDELKSLCDPDDVVAEVGLVSDSELILDMGAGNEIVDGAGLDFYYYEFPNGPGIYMDLSEVAVAPDNGSGQPGDFVTIFVWGDCNPNNNGTIPEKYMPEIPNRAIDAVDLHEGTGIGINIGFENGAHYRFVQFKTHPHTADPPADKQVQVDSIERIGAFK